VRDASVGTRSRCSSTVWSEPWGGGELPSHALAPPSVSAQIWLTRGAGVGIGGRMVTDASACTMQVWRGGGLKGVTVCTVGSEPWRGSLSDRMLIAENSVALLFSFHPCHRHAASAPDVDRPPYMAKESSSPRISDARTVRISDARTFIAAEHPSQLGCG
jgi:hypothetical protein